MCAFFRAADSCRVLEIPPKPRCSPSGVFFRSMLGYLALWCTVVLKIEEPWETKHPKAIPVMAIVGFSNASCPESGSLGREKPCQNTASFLAMLGFGDGETQGIGWMLGPERRSMLWVLFVNGLSIHAPFPSTIQPAHPASQPALHRSIDRRFDPSIEISSYPCLHPSVHPSSQPSIHRSIQLCIYPSIRPSIDLSNLISFNPN